MIWLMIKINLLPQKEMKRRKRASVPGDGGGNIAALFGLVIIMELGGLMYWYSQAEEATAAGAGDMTELQAEKGALNKRLKTINEITDLEEEVGKQRVVFETLEHQKVGPVNSLLFLSFALRRVDAGMQEDEYRVLADLWSPTSANADEDAGLPGEDTWNPDSVWLTGFKQKDNMIEIYGEAKEHEDVMTFLRRMKSSIYFEGIDLISQRVEAKSPLGQTFVSFGFKAFMNFNPREYPPL